MPEQHRRFPPPWSIEDNGGCFIVKDKNGRRPRLTFRHTVIFQKGTARSQCRHRPTPGVEWSRPCSRSVCSAPAAAARRSTPSQPQRMTATAHGSGAWCSHRSQFSHSQGVARCRSPSVVVAQGVFMGGIGRPPGEPSPAATHCGRLEKAAPTRTSAGKITARDPLDPTF